MVTKDGLVKILDFGLAKLTQSGEEAGGRGERAADDDAGDGARDDLGTSGTCRRSRRRDGGLDARSDQFSFGSILYEMATGKRAFELGTKVQTCRRSSRTNRRRSGRVNSKLPANFCWIVERCLARSRRGATRLRGTSPVDPRCCGITPRRSDRFRRVSKSLTRRREVPSRSWEGSSSLASAHRRVASVWETGSVRKERIHGMPLPESSAVLPFAAGYLTGARFAPGRP